MRQRVVFFLLLLSGITPSLHGQPAEGTAGPAAALTLGPAGHGYRFRPSFTVLYSAADPALAMRSAAIPGVTYNVPTWKIRPGAQADLRPTSPRHITAGDGFDEAILRGSTGGRSPDPYRAAQAFPMEAVAAEQRGDTVFLRFPPSPIGRLSAYVLPAHHPYPLFHFRFAASRAGWYSIGYSGAPALDTLQLQEIWQPLIWQEKRFPDNTYLTMAFRCPIPTALMYDGRETLGVLAAPREYPFDPLPTMANSRFGVMLRNREGLAQPQLFAPVLGGAGSRGKPGDVWTFSGYWLREPADITHTYEKVARQVFGFGDYRHNAISSLNAALDHITDYTMSPYAWFVDSLKGCAYSTDVPGAVKNVSSLNPLELALVMDDSILFERRAFPVMTYMLSREKYLFSLDSTQKIQAPSRRLAGPVAPVSELAGLYTIFQRRSRFLLRLAAAAGRQDRVRNMEVVQPGDTWMNALYLYEASGDKTSLRRACEGADAYLRKRVARRAVAFRDPAAGAFFFWPSYTSRWIELLQLYEATGERKYLDAAWDGARHYALFLWMSPRIPGGAITVNPGGLAPVYPYLEHKGHRPMHYPEERVPAWRLSAMGLGAESSATSTGHRAIFMANYAPWMLRLGYYVQDTFLMQIAKAAVIGRYRNFPGYHINTARTTAYEKTDFPYHAFMDQSVTSFHYNHIMPMASMLLDYLVSDAFVRSEGAIRFPSEYIEGYAYLQSQFYGAHPGSWYGRDSVQLWMPRGLLQIDNVDVNYLSARKGDTLLIALMNTADHAVRCRFRCREDLVLVGTGARICYRQGKATAKKLLPSAGNSWTVPVDATGITTIEISGVTPHVAFQDKLLAPASAWKEDYMELPFGHARAMIFSLGAWGRRAYLWLGDDDNRFRQVSLQWETAAGRTARITDNSYPFEFTVPIDAAQSSFRFRLSGISSGGQHLCGSDRTLLASPDAHRRHASAPPASDNPEGHPAKK